MYKITLAGPPGFVSLEKNKRHIGDSCSSVWVRGRGELSSFPWWQKTISAPLRPFSAFQLKAQAYILFPRWRENQLDVPVQALQGWTGSSWSSSRYTLRDGDFSLWWRTITRTPDLIPLRYSSICSTTTRANVFQAIGFGVLLKEDVATLVRDAHKRSQKP